jgi:elongation factor 3
MIREYPDSFVLFQVALNLPSRNQLQFLSQLANEDCHIDAGRMVEETFSGSDIRLSLPAVLNSRPGSSAANADMEDNTEGIEFKSVKKGRKKKVT